MPYRDYQNVISMEVEPQRSCWKMRHAVISTYFTVILLCRPWWFKEY